METERGRMAQEIFDNAVYQDAMAFVRKETLEAIAATNPSETIERERLYMALKVWEHAEQFLVLTIQRGESEKIAKKQTEQIQTLGKRTWI